MEILQLGSLGENPVNCLITYDGPVFLNRVQPQGRRFISFLHSAPRAKPTIEQTAIGALRSLRTAGNEPRSHLQHPQFARAWPRTRERRDEPGGGLPSTCADPGPVLSATAIGYWAP